MIKRNRNSGFTIVELLIVIIIIGILATIVVVAYNGITKKARESSLMSDLNNNARLLEMYKAENGDYPAQGDEGQANNGQGLVASGSNTVTYTLDSGKYCLEAKDSSGQYIYKVEQDKSGISEGACVVMPTGPVITNYFPNDPSIETPNSATAFSYAISSPASIVTDSVVNGDAFAGNGYRRKTFTASGSIQAYSNPTMGYYVPGWVTGDIFTVSAYVRSSTNKSVQIGVLWRGAECVMGNPKGSPVMLTNTWQRISMQVSVPVDTYNCGLSGIQPMIYSASGSDFASGDVLDIDAAMITKGATLYQYADGDSTGWHWDGTPYSSTSSGPSSLP